MGRVVRLALAAVALALGAGLAARAQIAAPILFGHAPRVTYVGPGDVKSGALLWVGLRAYSAATVNTKAIQVTRASDSTTQDINSLSNGNLDVASASSFGGIDATCTATIASTTMTVTSCASGTLHIYDQITGAGITNPAFITAIGSCASPPGTCTLNASQTVAVGETVTAAVALTVSNLYDQTGNNHGMSAPGGRNNPLLFLNCVNTSLPCMASVGTVGAQQTTAVSVSYPSSLAQPFTYSLVAYRWGQFTKDQIIMEGSTGSFNAGVETNTTTNTWLQFAGSSVTKTANDSTLNAAQSVFNGSSSIFNINGSGTTTNPGTRGLTEVNLFYAQGLSGDFWCQCYINEAGLWGSAFSTGDNTNMYNNQHAYWGTP